MSLSSFYPQHRPGCCCHVAHAAFPLSASAARAIITSASPAAAMAKTTAGADGGAVEIGQAAGVRPCRATIHLWQVFLIGRCNGVRACIARALMSHRDATSCVHYLYYYKSNIYIMRISEVYLVVQPCRPMYMSEKSRFVAFQNFPLCEGSIIDVSLCVWCNVANYISFELQ